MLVVGIQHSKGSYNGYDFDNYKLHCLSPASGQESEGQLCDVIKVPKDLFESSKITVGDEVVPFYDRFGRITKIE